MAFQIFKGDILGMCFPARILATKGSSFSTLSSWRIAALLGLTALPVMTQAATMTWDDAGVSNVWSTSAANWIGGLSWSDGSAAIFNGAGETIEVDGNVVVTGTSNGIPPGIDLTVGGYNIVDSDNNGTLFLQGAGGGMGTAKVIIRSAGANTISANIVLSGSSNNQSRSLIGAAGSHLTISSNISEADVAKSLGISGQNSQLTLSGSNSYSGGTSIGNNGITLNANNARALGTGALTIGSSVSLTLGNTTGGSIAFANNNALNLTTTTAGTGLASNFTYSSANDLNFGTGAIAFGGNAARAISVTGAGKLTLGGAISENIVGTALIKNGVGTLELGGAGAYTGNTTVNAGTLLLSSTSESRFVIQNADTSNRFLGTGAVSFDGDFRLDITGLTNTSGTWNLVNVGTLNETFGLNFGLVFMDGTAFTNNLDGTYTSGNWTFSTTTGDLTLTAVPEPSVIGLLGAGLLLAVRRRRSGGGYR